MPWQIAHSPEELERLLVRLAADEDLRMAAGRDSRAFMETWWTEENIVRRLVEFYQR